MFPVLVPGPNVSDDGRHALFEDHPEPDRAALFRQRKADGSFAYEPTPKFMEYPIVKYLIGGRWCKLSLGRLGY